MKILEIRNSFSYRSYRWHRCHLYPSEEKCWQDKTSAYFWKKAKTKNLTLACYDWKTIPSDVGILSQKKRPCYFSNRDQNIFYLKDILKDQLNKYFGGNRIPKVFKNSEYRRSFLFTNCLSWIIFLHNQLAYKLYF